VLAALGAANMHQQNFPLFLGAVLGLSVLTVVVFVLTAPPTSPSDRRRRLTARGAARRAGD
jgi:hypothetical protein